MMIIGLDDLLQRLASVYGQQAGDVGAYAWALEDYDIETIKQAVKLHIKRSKWYPKPAELVTLCEEIDRHRQDIDNERNAYWLAMEKFGASLRNELAEDALFADRSWRWYERRRVLVDVENVAVDAANNYPI